VGYLGFLSILIHSAPAVSGTCAFHIRLRAHRGGGEDQKIGVLNGNKGETLLKVMISDVEEKAAVG